jgi:putative phosphoserine phosphatase/1-acylglycerol-3-phosphate O-acyltransferase
MKKRSALDRVDLPERATPRIGAFFDMDKTIIAENSGAMYMRHRYEHGDVTNWELAKGLGAYLRYKLGVLNLHSYTLELMQQFRGEREADLEALGLELFEEMLVGAIYPEAARLIREHQQAGHEVLIISGAVRFVVEPLAEHLGVPNVLCTRLEVDEGRFTGRLIEPICFEEGKIYWVQQFIEEQRIDLARSYFYTDSVTDIPLLELVGHPVVVNPDPMLYRAAVRRCWPVRIFDEPVAMSNEAGAGPPRAGTHTPASW